jgi:hypothetical protein
MTRAHDKRDLPMHSVITDPMFHPVVKKISQISWAISRKTNVTQLKGNMKPSAQKK